MSRQQRFSSQILLVLLLCTVFKTEGAEGCESIDSFPPTVTSFHLTENEVEFVEL